jgi:hypothetical protein
MQQWEYLSARAHNSGVPMDEITITLGYGEPEVPYAEIIHTFDTLGREGWELVSAYHVGPDARATTSAPDGARPSDVFFWFKRPLQSSAASTGEKGAARRSRRTGAGRTT